MASSTRHPGRPFRTSEARMMLFVGFILFVGLPIVGAIELHTTSVGITDKLNVASDQMRAKWIYLILASTSSLIALATGGLYVVEGLQYGPDKKLQQKLALVFPLVGLYAVFCAGGYGLTLLYEGMIPTR
jgi:hypothetical protein